MAEGTITSVVPGIGIAGGGFADAVEVSLDPAANITFSGTNLARQNDPPVNARTAQIANCRWVMNQLDAHGGGGTNGGGGGVGLWVGPNPPTNPATHPFWFDDSDAQLYVHDGMTWVIAVNPPGAGTGGGGGGGGLDTVNPNLAAAGTNQGGAAALAHQLNDITSGAGGVRWDNPQAGDHRYVRNSTSAAVMLYPPTGAQINSLGSNAGVYVQPNQTALVKAVSATKLITVP